MYSRHLFHSAIEYLEYERVYDPLRILTAAWDKTTVVDRIEGSCTVCLAHVNYSGELNGVNIGDSGLAVIRNGKETITNSLIPRKKRKGSHPCDTYANIYFALFDVPIYSF
jgi:hypothetical protein